MAFELYKSGQGYWTRLVSAIAIGVLILSGIGYLWSQIEAANPTLTRTYTATIPADQVQNTDRGWVDAIGLSSMQTLQSDVLDESNATPQVVGRGVRLTRVKADSPAAVAGLQGRDTILAVNGEQVSDVEALLARAKPAADGTISITYQRELRIAIFIQAGATLLVLGLLGPMVWRWVGTKPSTCDFLIATEGEMKKVNWPAQKEVIGSTWVVICCVFLILAVLFASDVLFSNLFRLIKVLDV